MLPLSICFCILVSGICANHHGSAQPRIGFSSNQAPPLPFSSSNAYRTPDRIWDVPMPTLHDKMFHTHPIEQQLLQGSNMTLLPAFAYISSSNSGSKIESSYHRTTFTHARPFYMDSSSSFSPDVPMLLLGAQSVSLYIQYSDNYDWESNVELISATSAQACIRRMQQQHATTDANVNEHPSSLPPYSSSSYSSIPSSFLCIPLNHSLNDLDSQLAAAQHSWRVVPVVPPSPAQPISLPVSYSWHIVKMDVLSPLTLLPTLVPDVTYESFTEIEIEVKLSRSHTNDSSYFVRTRSPPFFFDFTPHSTMFTSSVSPSSLYSPPPAFFLSTLPAVPRVHVPRRDAPYAYFIDEVFVAWPVESCIGNCSLVEAIDGQRVCACSSDSNSSETSRWWIFKNSGDVYTGLGVSPIAASINHRAVVDIIVFDCTAAVSQRAWFPRQPAYQHVTWLFVPWCLPSTQLHPASLRPSFFPEPTFNDDYVHLNAEVPVLQMPKFEDNVSLLQRMRGVLSLETAELILIGGSEVDAAASSTVVLDCGCCGWITLLSIADELLQQRTQSSFSSSSASSSSHCQAKMSNRAVVARLPLMGHSSSHPPHTLAQWHCDQAVNITQKDGTPVHSREKLRQVLMRIREAFRIVSWDSLSAEQLHVTLMPREGADCDQEHDATTFAKTVHGPSCAMGDVDVCGVEGCRNEDNARDCLPPKILDYVKTIKNMCIIRKRSKQMFNFQQPVQDVHSSSFPRPICSGLKQYNEQFVMKIADDDALLAIISYAAQHAKFSVDDDKSRERGAILVHLMHGGLGNLFQPLFAASLMAVLDGRHLLVSIGPKRRVQLEGHFTSAIDAFVSRDADDILQEMSNKSWHFDHVKSYYEEQEYIRCSWAAPHAAQSSYGAITQLSSGHFPVALLINDKHHEDIRKTFGVDADFYLSHFTLVPIGETRQRVADSIATIRSKYDTVIGVHMRWVAQGAQYVLAEDMDWFLLCALKLASSSSSSSVAFYVASDSIKHVLAFSKGIAAAASTAASNGAIGRRDWAVLTSEVLNNATDSSTVDSLGDLFMLSLCDHLIGTEFSTFTSLAAALGAHRPVIVGAHAAMRFGRNKMIRVSQFSPIRADIGGYFAQVLDCDKHAGRLACDSAAIRQPFFGPTFLSTLEHMNITPMGNCRLDMRSREVEAAGLWYENMYDVFEL